MSAADTFLEAVAALSAASGHLRELGREEIAHRCDAAAARVQALLLDEIDDAIEEETES